MKTFLITERLLLMKIERKIINARGWTHVTCSYRGVQSKDYFHSVSPQQVLNMSFDDHPYSFQYGEKIDNSSPLGSVCVDKAKPCPRKKCIHCESDLLSSYLT